MRFKIEEKTLRTPSITRSPLICTKPLIKYHFDAKVCEVKYKISKFSTDSRFKWVDGKGGITHLDYEMLSKFSFLFAKTYKSR